MSKSEFKQNLQRVSLFNLFLWIFAAGFAMMLASDLQAAEKKLYAAKGKRDPFIPLVTKGAKPSVTGGLIGVETLEEIVVEGIVADPDPKRSIAVLNGQVMKAGDEVGSVKVLRIDPDGALVTVNGIEGYKPLYQDENKKANE